MLTVCVGAILQSARTFFFLGAALLLLLRPLWAQQHMVYRCVDAKGGIAYQAERCRESRGESRVQLHVSPGRAPGSITFYYDPSGEPAGISTKEMEEFIVTASQRWMKGCEVRLHYGGRASARKVNSPEHSTIRWAPEYVGRPHPADAQSTLPATGGMKPGIAISPSLHKSALTEMLTHEIGHVIGLPHNHEDTQSIMSYLQDESLRRISQPSAADYAACNLAIKTLSRIGGAQAGPSLNQPDDRMSDVEAMEEIRHRRSEKLRAQPSDDEKTLKRK